MPYGTLNVWSNLIVGGGWFQTGDWNDDWGVIQYNTDIPAVGNIFLQVDTGYVSQGYFARVQGYPATDLMHLYGGTLIDKPNVRTIHIENSNASINLAGMSGSPLILWDHPGLWTTKSLGILRQVAHGKYFVCTAFDSGLFDYLLQYR